jgi:hypothetical protein
MHSNAAGVHTHYVAEGQELPSDLPDEVVLVGPGVAEPEPEPAPARRARAARVRATVSGDDVTVEEPGVP